MHYIIGIIISFIIGLIPLFITRITIFEKHNTKFASFLFNIGLMISAFGLSISFFSIYWETPWKMYFYNHMFIPTSFIYITGGFIVAGWAIYTSLDSYPKNKNYSSLKKYFKEKNARHKSARREYNRSKKDFMLGKITKEELKTRLRPYKKELNEMGLIKLKNE